MAPSFLSKLVKSPNNHSRSGSAETRRSNTRSPSPSTRDRLPPISTAANTSPNAKGALPSLQLVNDTGGRSSPSSDVSHPNVTIIPPSPHSSTSFSQIQPSRKSSRSSLIDGLPRTSDNTAEYLRSAKPLSSEEQQSSIQDIKSDTEEDLEATTPVQLNTPNTTSPKRSNSPKPPKLASSSSAGDLRQSGAQLQNKPPDRSINGLPPITTVSHGRAATEPASHSVDEHGVLNTMTPIVESPTTIQEFARAGSPEEPPPSTSVLSVPAQHDSDSVSVISAVDGSGKKKRTAWRKGSNTARKPTGLASAIAASGLAMANPTLSSSQQMQLSPSQVLPNNFSPTGTARKSSTGSTAYFSNSPPGSMDFNAGSAQSSRIVGSPSARRRSHSANVSTHSRDGFSDGFGDENGNYYPLEDSSDESASDSDVDNLLNDLDADMPVTGFAVASSKRNADFHELFTDIPEGDYLIEDYGCALQRDILIQGRIYISENHICFHANIFGWVTDLSIPIYEITQLEKKMTAFVIPNAITITTRQNKYQFTSFLARDTTYDVIYNIWRLARPDDAMSFAGDSQRPSLDGPLSEGGSATGLPSKGPVATKKVTQCACSKEKQHYPETALEIVVPGTPERIYNLIFASGFVKDFMRDNQKLMDIQISDWTPVEPGSKLLARNMSYIKPLNGSIGPKQTKCEIRDETVHCDFDDYVATVTTTRTPDVPSGGVFSVKTRTCIMWASAASSKVIVTTQVEWTGRSFIKGIIEKSAIDGQKVYHSDLDKAVRAYIQEHQSEFIPEGLSVDEVDAAVDTSGPDTPAAKSTGEPTLDANKKREHERNQRSLQWAWDTFSGASDVAKRSTSGAIELITDAWEQSSSTTILIFIIVFLVISNIWTLTRMGSKEEVGRRKEMRKIEEREKWIQGVVATLFEELTAAKSVNGARASPYSGDTATDQPSIATDASGVHGELESIHASLDQLERRVQAIRGRLPSVKDLD